ncbi:aminodeoxyfutalosine deaminase [Candidatus Magnetomoraceae bacterium gMMP-15]
MQTQSSIHKAGWILLDPNTIIRDGFIKVDSGVIKEVGHGRSFGISEQIIDHGPGVLMPGLVNVHTHLELCAIKDKVPYEHGFLSWVRKLTTEREAVEKSVLLQKAEQGIEELFKSGCRLAGEISSLGLTWKMLSDSGVGGVWFQEVLGSKINIEMSCYNQNQHLMKSLAGHAPHTTSPQVLITLKKAARNHPFSIHLAESRDEIEFMTKVSGQWADFLLERGINFSDWPLPAKSSVQYLENLGLFDKNTIAVHLIYTNKKDFEILLKHNVKVCLCLRSNNNLHKKLPDLPAMLKARIKPCLGTDSLASADSLSIFDEMAFIFKNFPHVKPSEILEMATLNGAKALGMSKWFGSLVPGKYASFIYIPIEISSSNNLIERLIIS